MFRKIYYLKQNQPCLFQKVTEYKCTVQSKKGETCSPSGDDDSCEGNLACVQHADNEYRCREPELKFTEAFEEWASYLREGEGCYLDGQCQSGWCAHENRERGNSNHQYMIDNILQQRNYSNIKAQTCVQPSLDGEPCENGWDSYCVGDLVCAQYAENDYFCAKADDVYVPTGAVTEYIKNLNTGDGCKYHGQCTTGWCYEEECAALKGKGDTCDEEGGLDFICAMPTGEDFERKEIPCAQRAEGKYFCTETAYTPVGATSEFASGLDSGLGCKSIR